MTRKLRGLLIVLGVLGVHAAARAEGGASLTYCNFSTTHTIYIAEAWTPATATGAYRAAGWRKIEPNICSDAISDLHTMTRLWIRALSENRLIRGTREQGIATKGESDNGFCTDSRVSFDNTWQTLESAGTDCDFGKPSRLYPITVLIDQPGVYRINLDPDPWIANFPPVQEPKQDQGPGIALALQKVSKLNFECYGCIGNFPADKAVAEEIFEAPMLVCKYGPKPYSMDNRYRTSNYWYKAPPKGLKIWLDEDTSGHSRDFGLSGVTTCPADSNAADRLDRELMLELKRAYPSS